MAEFIDSVARHAVLFIVIRVSALSLMEETMCMLWLLLLHWLTGHLGITSHHTQLIEGPICVVKTSLEI